MKKPTFILILLFCFSSFSCHSLGSSRPGMVMSDCSRIVSEVRALQPGTIPAHLLLTGKKRGDEFDVNQYFEPLSHIAPREGYVLDYVYQDDGLTGYPWLYARPVDQVPYASTADIPAEEDRPDFREYLDMEDTEQGYLDYVVMDIVADQFYLIRHARYNDSQIVCNRQQLYDIVAQLGSGDFGNVMDPDQQQQARFLRNIVPVVRLTEDTAVVEIVTFTKWGGFYRRTYTIRREAPHRIMDIQQENILPYDCGIVF
jgi:hypothetical protein